MDRAELLHHASHYRDVALRVTNAPIRAGLLDLAATYEALAKEVEKGTAANPDRQ